MIQSKHTKRALLTSVLSVVACCALLIGSTFAWFTDEVTSGNNKIVAGNLDVELSYQNAKMTDFAEVTSNTADLFVTKEGKDILWEPGVAAVTYLKLENAGSLALKYQLSVLAQDVVTGDDGAALSKVLKSAAVEIAASEVGTYDRAKAIAAAEAADAESVLTYSKTATMTADAQPLYLALIVYFPEEVGNEVDGAVYNRDDVKLETDLSLSLVAAQTPHESDSFDENYDEQAASDENMKLLELEAQGWNLVASASDIDGDGKYVLTEDIADAVTLAATDNAVLDLNGKTISGNLTVAGDVTLTDSSEGETGEIPEGTITVKDNSTLTIEAGTYKRISPSSTSTIVVDGGTITGQSYGGKATWIINDGHFSHTAPFGMTQGETVTINGGTFDGIVDFGSKANPAKVIINGGIFNGDVAADYGKWTITGGEFYGPFFASVSAAYKYVDCTIAGGVFHHTGNKCTHGNSHYMFYGNASTPSNYYNGYTITGGSFKTDPTAFMDAVSGTVEQDSNGYYVVSAN